MLAGRIQSQCQTFSTEHTHGSSCAGLYVAHLSLPTLVLTVTAELQPMVLVELQAVGAVAFWAITLHDASRISASSLSVWLRLQTRKSLKALPYWWAQAQDLALLAGSFKCGMWPSSQRTLTEAMFRDPDSPLYRMIVRCFVQVLRCQLSSRHLIPGPAASASTCGPRSAGNHARQ